MTILSSSSEIWKKVLLAFIEDVAKNKKDALKKWYKYLAQQLQTVSLKNSKTEWTENELIDNLLWNKDTTESPYNSILWYDGFSKEELIQIRDALIAPFVSDIYAEWSDNEDVNLLVQNIIANDPLIVQKATLLTKEIESAINLHKIED